MFHSCQAVCIVIEGMKMNKNLYFGEKFAKFVMPIHFVAQYYKANLSFMIPICLALGYNLSKFALLVKLKLLPQFANIWWNPLCQLC